MDIVDELRSYTVFVFADRIRLVDGLGDVEAALPVPPLACRAPRAYRVDLCEFPLEDFSRIAECLS